MLPQQEIIHLIDQYTQEIAYQDLHWEGTFGDYLAIVSLGRNLRGLPGDRQPETRCPARRLPADL